MSDRTYDRLTRSNEGAVTRNARDECVHAWEKQRQGEGSWARERARGEGAEKSVYCEEVSKHNCTPYGCKTWAA